MRPLSAPRGPLGRLLKLTTARRAVAMHDAAFAYADRYTTLMRAFTR